MSPRNLALLSLGLVVVGCVVCAIGTAVWIDVVGIMIAGIGAVGLLAAFFYAIGQADDSYREKHPHG
jgi:1,4-dihydroxy-2-naphthoate octaprenyltransferase